MPAQKIATCCYCGTRAALVLRGRDRHELACSSCGAPLHNLKMLPIPSEFAGSQADRATARSATPARPAPKPIHPNQPHPRAVRVENRSRRKGLWRKVLEEAWDVIEDIID